MTTSYRKQTFLVLGEMLLLFLAVSIITEFPLARRLVQSWTSSDRAPLKHSATEAASPSPGPDHPDGRRAAPPQKPAIPTRELVRALIRVLIIIATCQLCYFFNDLYDWRVTSNTNQTAILLLQSVAHAAIILAILYYAFMAVDRVFFDGEKIVQEAYGVHPLIAGFDLMVIYPLSYYYRIAFHLSVKWRLNERILFVGVSPMSHTIEKELSERKDPGYEIVGYLAREEPSQLALPPDRRLLGSFDKMHEVARRERVNRMVVTLPERRGNLPILELLNCRLGGIRIEEGELLYERITGKIAIEKLRPSYLIFSEGFHRSKFNYIFKRAMDVGVSVLGLLLSLPVSLATALAIKLESPGPILFRQTRVGKDGKVFTLYKFRSMREDAEAHTGPVWAQTNDARVTRIGRIIRLLRIDEIPQMWNVVRNEMSFVGPRPERPFFVEELKREIPYYMERLVVKPGITGWAQINYRYGSTKDDAIEKLQYDLYYIKNMSIFFDIVIILSTIKVILLRRGAA
ncbi:MAG: TIGR03013 family XrtA/PEP-CTERM system glycosyltransferase [Planctomycetota bacterium]